MASGSRQRGGRPRKRSRGGASRKAARGRDDRIRVTTTEMATAITENAFDGASQITGAMECESYASGIAAMWDWARLVRDAETTNAIGGTVIDILARSEHTFALPMLRALAAVAEAPINDYAYGAGTRARSDAWRPAWLHAIGSGEISAAARVGDPTTDEGTTVLFDLQWSDGQRGGMGVFIDPRLEGCAKHILVGPTLGETIEMFESGDDPQPHDELDVADAADIVESAMAVSDLLWSRELGETYPPMRGFVKRQLRNLRAPRPRGAAERELDTR